MAKGLSRPSPLSLTDCSELVETLLYFNEKWVKINSSMCFSDCLTCSPLPAPSVLSRSADAGVFLSSCPLQLTWPMCPEAAPGEEGITFVSHFSSRLPFSLSSPAVGVGISSGLLFFFFFLKKGKKPTQAFVVDVHCIFGALPGNKRLKRDKTGFSFKARSGMVCESQIWYFLFAGLSH